MKIVTRISVQHLRWTPSTFFPSTILPPRGVIGSQIEFSETLYSSRESPAKFGPGKNGHFGLIRYLHQLGHFSTFYTPNLVYTPLLTCTRGARGGKNFLDFFY